ncbi:hypothetical protein, partial [Motilimonas sp. E26]|uniref:hypothetical protein n=1 Tax=Motilimonas sp. E26 TaxID=2865674 RepID=UPI001E2BD899
GLINQESTFGATPSLIAHRMNNAITGGGDKYAALAKAKEAVDLLTGPQKQDVNVPVIPLDKVPNLVEFEQPVAAPILVPAENPQRVKQGEPSPILQLESSLPVASLPESQIEPAIKDHGEPELRTYEENYFGYIEVAPEGYNIPPVPDEEAPTYLTPEIIQQQASILESACLTNTQEFVKATGMSLNILGGADFQEIKTDLTTDKERLSYSMEIFSLLQQILAENPDIQEAVARQHAGGSKNSHIKATWTLSMDTGASYSLSTNSSQAYQANIDIVINNQGSIVIYDHNGLELARIVSSTQNGHCNNATYDVVIAEHH